MKKKAVVGIISCLTLIGLVVLLSFTLFSLKEIKVNYRTNREDVSISDQQIINASDMKLGGSVFFRNKQAYIDNIEKEFPYLNVINIETVFPSTMVLHIAERQEVYAVEGEDGIYICDEEFHVLKIKEEYDSTMENAMRLQGDFKIKNEKVGEKLNIANPMLYQEMVKNNYTLGMCKELIQSVEMTKVHDEGLNAQVDVLKLNLFAGQTITIANYYNNLSYKTHLFVQVFSNLFSMEGKESLQADGSMAILTYENLKTCEIYINNYYTHEGEYAPNNQNCYFKIFVAQGV